MGGKTLFTVTPKWKKGAKALKTAGFWLITFGAWGMAPAFGMGWLADPFHIGVLFMAIISLVNLLGGLEDQEGEAWSFFFMTFFILTKILSQITHAMHLGYDGWGNKAVHAAKEACIAKEVVEDAVESSRL